MRHLDRKVGGNALWADHWVAAAWIKASVEIALIYVRVEVDSECVELSCVR